MPLPTFLIVGAQKAGTTSLWSYLKQHPDILMPDEKELCFFSVEKNYKKGKDWYEHFFRKWNGEKEVGEADPSSMHDKEVPERIANLMPNVKLIFMLRNPIKRAYSEYCMDIRNDRINISMQEIFTKEIQEMPKDYLCSSKNKDSLPSLIRKGIYWKQIENFLKYFSPAQMHFVLLENLHENPQKETEDILAFLKVKPIPKLDFPHRHKGYISKNHLLDRYKKKAQRKFPTINETFMQLRHKIYSDDAKFPLRKPMRKLLSKIVFWEQKIPPIPEETQEYLQKFYNPHNKKLEELIGIDLSIWNVSH